MESVGGPAQLSARENFLYCGLVASGEGPWPRSGTLTEREKSGMRIPHGQDTSLSRIPGWGQPGHAHPAASGPGGLEQVGVLLMPGICPFPGLVTSVKQKGWIRGPL